MFTGIIQGTGRLVEKKSVGGGLAFRLEADFDLSDPIEGESIAVNGSCLTAYNIDKRRFSVDISPESVQRTTLGSLVVGSLVNMERALKLSDRLGGHMVSGHVDCTAQVAEVREVGDFTLYSFVLGEDLGRYVIEKGSIAIDGVSLTVNSCEDKLFSVSIIPHTMQSTTWGLLKEGSRVNIEVDLIGKYVEKLLMVKPEGMSNKGNKINPGFLAEHGFY